MAVMAGVINAPQMESSRARIGRKAIITEEGAIMLNIKLVSWALGLWSAITFISYA